MDLMTQLPYAATPARNPDRPAESKSRTADEPETSPVSFPSILQETRQPEKTGPNKVQDDNSKEMVSIKDAPNIPSPIIPNHKKAMGTAQPTPRQDKPSLLNILTPRNSNETPSGPLTGPKIINFQQSQMTASPTVGVSQEQEITAAKVTAQVGKTIATTVGNAPSSATVGNAPSATTVEGEPAETLVVGETKISKPETLGVEAGKTPALQPSKMPQVAASEKVNSSLPHQPLTGKTNVVPMDDLNKEPTSAKVGVPEQAQTGHQALPTAPAVSASPVVESEGKMEQIQVSHDAKVTSETEEISHEVASLVKPNSAEIELLSAQSNAQKVYHQPAASVEQGTAPTPTLADLDLDSGSLDSKENKQESLARVLSATTTTVAAKKSIQGQVLSQVVKHLQDEMGREKLTIRLNPEKLGQVEIQFQSLGDSLDIVVSASNKEAESVIREGARELAENIADKSPRWNLVDVRVETKGQDQSKQETRQNERRDKQDEETKQQNQSRQNKQDQQNNTGAGEWAAFHLGG